VLVPAADIESYAQQVVALIDDAARRSAMGEIGRERVRADIAWERQSARYLDIIRRLGARARTDAAPGGGQPLSGRFRALAKSFSSS
jgi:hypothetical protein